MVLPPAPVLLPDRSRVIPDACSEILAACDQVLAPAVAGVSEVAVVAASDHLRDLTGPGTDSAEHFGARVADSMLDRAGFRGARIRLSPGDDRRDAEVWLLMADGSASVGERSPRPGQDGAGFDDFLHRTLRAGNTAELGTITDTAAMAVGCTTAAVWRRLAQLAPEGATCASLLLFAPFGVQYFVGSLNAEAGTR